AVNDHRRLPELATIADLHRGAALDHGVVGEHDVRADHDPAFAVDLGAEVATKLGRGAGNERAFARHVQAEAWTDVDRLLEVHGADRMPEHDPPLAKTRHDPGAPAVAD